MSSAEKEYITKQISERLKKKNVKNFGTIKLKFKLIDTLQSGEVIIHARSGTSAAKGRDKLQLMGIKLRYHNTQNKEDANWWITEFGHLAVVNTTNSFGG